MSANTSFNKYNLKSTLCNGGLEVFDSTSGIAKAVEHDEQNIYLITVNNKHLTFPTSSKASDGIFYLSESKKITFEKDLKDSNIIKITEIDNHATNVFFVDTNNQLVDGVAYDVYNYKPETITKNSAIEKLKALVKDKTFFKPDMLAYNRHGITAFGWDANQKNYAFYYANPQDKEMTNLKCNEIKRFRDGGTTIVKSADCFVNFRFLISTNKFFLNTETAESININDIQ